MPVDKEFTDPFSSSFLLNVNSSFSLDKISLPPQLNTSGDRKRKYFEDEDQDIRSSLAPYEFQCFTYDDVKRDEKNGRLQIPSESKTSTSLDIVDKTDDKQDPNLHDFYSFTSETDQQIVTSPKKQGTHLFSEDRAFPNDRGARAVPYDTDARTVHNDRGARAAPNDTGSKEVPYDTNARPVHNDTDARAVPNDMGTRAVPKEIRNREVLSSILNNLPSRVMSDERDFGANSTDQVNGKDSRSYVQLPMKNLIESLAQQIKDGIVQDWSGVFSKMECFETVNLEHLDQILTAALVYEAKLKSEKAELRNFLMKLSGVLQHD